MLFSLRHGQTAVPRPANAPQALRAAVDAKSDKVALDRVVTKAAAAEMRGRFGYLYVSAKGHGPTVPKAALDALADGMAEPDDSTPPSSIPPIFTYFGQFIDHDVTANTDRDIVNATKAFEIGGPGDVLTVVPRSLAVSAVENLRNSKLELDSVYGDGPDDFPIERKLVNGAKLRVGTVSPGAPPGSVRVARPVDDEADLPRVGTLVRAGILTAAEVPTALLSTDANGALPVEESKKAFVGDDRNDENLIVAQLHVAFLRFHNAVVDAMGPGGGQSDAAILQSARRTVKHTYQWLVVNEYLPRVCNAAGLQRVMQQDAPVYARFFEDRRDELPAGMLPVPLEFSVAAFRFGHSMIRAEYDYNANFGPEGPRGLATFKQLFEFTGKEQTAPIGGFGLDRLPFNWIIDWERFIHGETPERCARKIDASIALPLTTLLNETAERPFKHLARRNLYRGCLLNLPTAQGLLDALDDDGIVLTRLTREQLLSGPTGTAVTTGGFEDATPLWFYILKEAEALESGERLGPLGTLIVAETLVGLVANDPGSYWARAGSGFRGRWQPADGVQVGGAPVDSLEALLRAAGVLT